MNTLQKSVLFVLYLLLIYIFIHTYIYLDQLNSCECFQQNKKYAVNIEFMKMFQILEIIIFTIYFGIMVFINKSKKLNLISISKNKLVLSFISTILLIILFGISGYMAYNVLNLYNNVKEECKCSSGFYKYFVYYEGILSISNILRFVSLFVTLFVAILFNNLR